MMSPIKMDTLLLCFETLEYEEHSCLHEVLD
jgi:hypothetical protein